MAESDRQLLLKKVRIHTVAITTDTSGGYTTTLKTNGTIKKVWFDQNTLADNVDLVITDSTTGEEIINFPNLSTDKLAYPRKVAQTKVGADLTGDMNIFTEFCAEEVTITIADGGSVLAGIVYIWVG